MRDWTAKTIRVTLDLTPDEVELLDKMVKLRRTKTRARLLRQIIRFHSVLTEYKELGYLIQAIKQGHLLQFPDLDVPYPQEGRKR
jgi:hypothetical protein